MAHSTQVVNLIGLDLANELGEVGGISQITVMEEEADFTGMTVAVNMLNTGGVE